MQNNRPSQDKKIRVNYQITSQKILLIGNDGEKLGTFALRDAVNKALAESLDLIEINFNAKENESVCKIADFGKYLFEKKKREKEQSKIQRENIIHLKEIQIKSTTDKHDLEIKARKTLEFLEEGDRVKISLRLHGREISRKDVAMQTFNDFLSFFDKSYVERGLSSEGRELMATLFKKK